MLHVHFGERAFGACAFLPILLCVRDKVLDETSFRQNVAVDKMWSCRFITDVCIQLIQLIRVEASLSSLSLAFSGIPGSLRGNLM